MKAYIVFKTDLSSTYCGAGPYILITEDEKVIGEHWCSSRGFANHDLTEWRKKELHENGITKVFSNNEIVWENDTMTESAKAGFRSANYDYERKNSDALWK